MTFEERRFGIEQLEASAAVLKQALDGLDRERFQAKPAVGGWSVAEVVEHVTIVESRYLAGILPACLANPRRDAVDASKDAMFAGIRSRTSKVNGPPAVQPKGNEDTPEEAFAKFAVLRQANIDYLRATDVELRLHASAHPLFGELDAYQWLLILAEHTLRHVSQIEEIKAGS